jgi:hypothetical protein
MWIGIEKSDIRRAIEAASASFESPAAELYATFTPLWVERI